MQMNFTQMYESFQALENPSFWQDIYIALASWLVVMGISGIVSLASLVAAVVMIAAGWWIYPLCQDGDVSPQILYVAFFTVVGALVILKHRSNIARLLNGTEHSFYSKKSK